MSTSTAVSPFTYFLFWYMFCAFDLGCAIGMSVLLSTQEKPSAGCAAQPVHITLCAVVSSTEI